MGAEWPQGTVREDAVPSDASSTLSQPGPGPPQEKAEAGKEAIAVVQPRDDKGLN